MAWKAHSRFPCVCTMSQSWKLLESKEVQPTLPIMLIMVSLDCWYRLKWRCVHNGAKTAISKWPVDAWEVAKLYIPTLGNNMSMVRNAETTNLSFFDVLKWMKDVAFGGDRRPDVNLDEKLRTEDRKADRTDWFRHFIEIASIHAPLRFKKVRS